MICSCGAVNLTVRRDIEEVGVFLATGVATIRLPGIMRIEHLNCGTCIGLAYDGTIPNDCGCGSAHQPHVAFPDDVLPVIEGLDGIVHNCPCGALGWERARDGGLVATGAGALFVWANDDGIVLRRAFCNHCQWVVE